MCQLHVNKENSSEKSWSVYSQVPHVCEFYLGMLLNRANVAMTSFAPKSLSSLFTNDFSQTWTSKNFQKTMTSTAMNLVSDANELYSTNLASKTSNSVLHNFTTMASAIGSNVVNMTSNHSSSNQQNITSYSTSGLNENVLNRSIESGFSSPENRLSEESLIGLIFLYSVTTLLSITGNILVVIVFSKGRRSRTDIRIFLINLAAADLIMATFCMPFTFADTILGHWVFSKPLCPLVLFMQHLSVAASVFTNMAIGIDRFLAVTFPLHSRITFKRGKYVIAIVWISSISLSTVQLVVGKGFDVDPDNNVVMCKEDWPSIESQRIFTIFILFLTYIVPLSILLLTYAVVGVVLWKRTAPGNKHEHRDIHQLRTKIKIVKMLVIVVVMFGICWLPIHAFALYMDAHPKILEQQDPDRMKLLITLYLSAHWLAMSNSFANPIIYGFTNESFRADLILILHNWFPCCYCFRGLMMRTYSLSNYDSVMYRRNTTLRRGSAQNSSASFGSWKRLKPLTYQMSIVRKDNNNGFQKAYSNENKKKQEKIQTNGVKNNHIYTFRNTIRPSSPLFDDSGETD